MSEQEETRRLPMSPTIALLSLLLVGSVAAMPQADVEAFDGSFRLESGETLTGGYFVEGGAARWVYLDPVGLDKGGLFDRVGETVLRSAAMLGDGGTEIEFIAGPGGSYDEIVWREPGAEPVRGRRVHPHTSHEVSFRSGDGTGLEGRLLVPDCPGPHPVLVSVHGSGPVNRYGGPFHTFFLQYGMAVLAYDKRDYTDDPEAWVEPDFADLSADVEAAIRFVAAEPGIDTDRIGVFGTSQGGWTAPPAAVAAPEADFLILRVGPAEASIEVILHEIRQELRAGGMSGLDLDNAMALRRELYEMALAGAPIAATDRVVAPYLEESWYVDAFGEGPILSSWSSRWWEAAERNLAWSPAPALARFGGPVLWFLAERDENVPLVSTRAALERAFEAAPTDDQEIVVIEDVPHSFFVETEQGARYADGFFDRMESWLTEHGFTNAVCR